MENKAPNTFKKIHSNSAIKRTTYITMEKYLITSSAVGKNKIRKFVFFWMMHGLYVIGFKQPK